MEFKAGDQNFGCSHCKTSLKMLLLYSDGIWAIGSTVVKNRWTGSEENSTVLYIWVDS